MYAVLRSLPYYPSLISGCKALQERNNATTIASLLAISGRTNNVKDESQLKGKTLKEVDDLSSWKVSLLFIPFIFITWTVFARCQQILKKVRNVTDRPPVHM